MRLHRLIPLLAATAMVAACGQMPSPLPTTPPSPEAMTPSAPSPQLTTHLWSLTSVYDTRGQAQANWLAPGHGVRLQFDGGRLSVQGLCNHMGGSYRLEGARLRVQDLMSTKRACADRALMALEERVGTQLPQAQGYALRPAQGSAAPTLVLQFADGSRWELAGTPLAAAR